MKQHIKKRQGKPIIPDTIIPVLSLRNSGAVQKPKKRRIKSSKPSPSTIKKLYVKAVLSRSSKAKRKAAASQPNVSTVPSNGKDSKSTKAKGSNKPIPAHKQARIHKEARIYGNKPHVVTPGHTNKRKPHVVTPDLSHKPPQAVSSRSRRSRFDSDPDTQNGAEQGGRDEFTLASKRIDQNWRRFFRKGKFLRPTEKPPSDKLIKAICALIRQGNYPEVASRAFGIRVSLFRSWVTKGFEDVQAGESTQYALFVIAVDSADAHAEVQDISAIRKAVDNWQALAWLRERKSFQRWGIKSLQITGSVDDMVQGREITTHQITTEVGSQVLVALEEAGLISLPGEEHKSGIAEVIDIPGSTVPHTSVDAASPDDIEQAHIPD